MVAVVVTPPDVVVHRAGAVGAGDPGGAAGVGHVVAGAAGQVAGEGARAWKKEKKDARESTKLRST